MPFRLAEVWGGTDAVIERGPGQASFDPARDSSYDQVILADLTAYGSYWKFNEQSGTTLADRGQFGLTATLTNPGVEGINAYPGPVPGDPFGNTSVRFTSLTTRATIATDDYAFGGTSPFTLELWMHPLGWGRSGGGNAYLMVHGSPGVTNSGYRLAQASNGTLTFQRFDVLNTSDTTTSTGTVLPRVWSHVVATYDGANLRIYVNGALAAGPTAGTRAIEANTKGALTIGNFTNVTNNAFDGYIARPAVYSTALSAAQVLTHFQAGVATNWNPPLSPNPLGLQLGSLKWEQDFPQAPAAGGTPVTVSPDVALLTLSADTDIPAIAMAPTLGTLTLSSSAPTVAEAMTPTIGNLTLGAVSSPPAIAVTPTPATLSLSASAPTVSITIDGTATVDTAILLLQGGSNAPTSVVSPSIGNLTLSAAAPTVAEQLTPPIGNLILGADAPSIVSGIFVNEPIGTLALSAVAPALALSVAPTPAVLTLSGGANTTSGGAPSAQQDQSAPQWLFFLQ